MHYYTCTDNNESIDGKQENIPAMDYTYIQGEEEEGNSITNLYQGLPELMPRNRTPDKIPLDQLEAPRTFAASSATEAEEIIAREGKHANGSTTLRGPKRVWRPKVRMLYEEPEEILDTSGNLD